MLGVLLSKSYYGRVPAGEVGDTFLSQDTQVQTFTTLSENPNAFVCSDPNVVTPPDGSPPLPALFTNDFINAGGFEVVPWRLPESKEWLRA